MQDQSSETRTCRRCGETKPAVAFSSHWRKLWCKRCYADVEMARNRRRGMSPARRAEYDNSGCRRCSACGQFKPTEQFARGSKRGVKKRMPYCKRCIADRANRWRAANPERARAGVRAAWKTNSDRYATRRLIWVAANRDRTMMYRRRRRARIAGARQDRFTLADWNELKALFGYRCAYCWQVNTRLEQDHVRPLSRGGDHTLDNIIPACRPCNASKSTKTLLEFLLTM